MKILEIQARLNLTYNEAKKFKEQAELLGLFSVSGAYTDGKHKRQITEKELKIAAKEINLQYGLIEYIIGQVRKRQEKSGNLR